MKRFLTLSFLAIGCAFGAEDSAILKQHIEKLEREVATLKEENRKLREIASLRERDHARKVYVEVIVPKLKPMLHDFGLDESIFVPVERIETLADAYRPLLLTIAKIGLPSSATK